MTSCECGCGAEVQRRFVRGHDSRMRSRLPEGQKHKNYRAKLREQVLAAYGGKCACCGESEPVFLTLDHVNEDGAAHRRSLGGYTHGGTTVVYRFVVQNGFPSDYQLLCFNCNYAKHRGGCPHLTGGFDAPL